MTRAARSRARTLKRIALAFESQEEAQMAARADSAAVRGGPRKPIPERRPWSYLTDQARVLRRMAKDASAGARADLLREAEELERQAYEMALAARTVLPAAPDKK